MRVLDRFDRRTCRFILLGCTFFCAFFTSHLSWAHSPSPDISKEHLTTIDHTGMCDASAAEAVGTHMFVVASDEDNLLRVFASRTPGKPIYTYDLNPFLKPEKKHPEADIEGAARIENRVYWITSHGTNKNGHQRKSRHRLFATWFVQNGDKLVIQPVGTPYEDLVKDLIMAPQLRGFHLNRAAKRAHQKQGALNIEGLCGTPKGTLLIGFRNPIPQGNALLVPLENPAEVISGKQARFGNPILLPLDGLGVRGMAYAAMRKAYLIIAGPHDEKRNFRLFEWSGRASQKPRRIDGVDFGGLQPEAMVVYPEHDQQLLIISDDGTRKMGTKACKNSPPDERRFRTIWITP